MEGAAAGRFSIRCSRCGWRGSRRGAAGGAPRRGGMPPWWAPGRAAAARAARCLWSEDKEITGVRESWLTQKAALPRNMFDRWVLHPMVRAGLAGICGWWTLVRQLGLIAWMSIVWSQGGTRAARRAHLHKVIWSSTCVPPLYTCRDHAPTREPSRCRGSWRSSPEPSEKNASSSFSLLFYSRQFLTCLEMWAKRITFSLLS